MRTLVYVGINRGNSLWGYCRNYDRVIGFEAQPHLFEIAKQRNSYQHVELINAAVWDSDGEKDFFVTTNEVSSSLGILDNAYLSKYIKVKTLNLFDFLQRNNVDTITTYISDIQGADLTVLKTLKPYIDNRKIENMMLETHNDGLIVYKGLNNQFKGFKELLNLNYKIQKITCDGTLLLTGDNVDSNIIEFDVHWALN